MEVLQQLYSWLAQEQVKRPELEPAYVESRQPQDVVLVTTSDVGEGEVSLSTSPGPSPSPFDYPLVATIACAHDLPLLLAHNVPHSEVFPLRLLQTT